ncbi:hypothetical protein Cadr_000024497 [Camelus dromedarius]|uniref:Uncharacterized protein n=1 Tax=Camelus dromedarius TaxID=9838 RepID=A0A5N4CNI1_CAMDR|nr:hypothetical protein Cadr_000024497 [Camelus dromedarius]
MAEQLRAQRPGQDAAVGRSDSLTWAFLQPTSMSGCVCATDVNHTARWPSDQHPSLQTNTMATTQRLVQAGRGCPPQCICRACPNLPRMGAYSTLQTEHPRIKCRPLVFSSPLRGSPENHCFENSWRGKQIELSVLGEPGEQERFLETLQDLTSNSSCDLVQTTAVWD